jgi:hypothetical protein
MSWRTSCPVHAVGRPFHLEIVAFLSARQAKNFSRNL